MSLLDTLIIQEYIQPPARMNRKTTRANSSLIQPMILKQSCTVRLTTTNQHDALNPLSPALNPNGIASCGPSPFATGFAAWPGSQQEASQIAARQKVVTQSQAAIGDFISEVRKTCFCRKEMLFRP